MNAHIHISENPESLAIDVRDWLVSSIQEHCRATDSPYVISLSGGSTPKRLYALLAELPTGDVSWDRVVLCWGDERNVDPDHADSNFRMVREALLDRIDIPADNVLAVPNPGADAAQAAAAYEQLLRERIALDSNGLPILDCVLLGMGDDVHTASLFPDSSALKEQSRIVCENWVEKFDCFRITMTEPVLNAARRVAFVVAGAAKQTALHQLWHGRRDSSLYPAQLIQPTEGELLYFLDQAALGDNDVPKGVQPLGA